MLIGRISGRLSTVAKKSYGLRNTVALISSNGVKQQKHLFHLYAPLNQSPLIHNKVVGGHVSLLHDATPTLSSLQRFGFSSSASPEAHMKDAAKKSENASSNASEQDEVSDKKKSSASDQEEESGSDEDLSTEDLVKLVAEKEEILKGKTKEIETMKDKVLRTYAEMENVMDRTRREAENSKKFAIQSFAKGLLDVADNMGRASSVVKDSFAKMDTSEDSTGAVPLLKTLLEGVEMTEKQLAEVFKKFGVEKYDPINEQFDPHRHNAVFQVPDPAKDPDTVAVVLKSGYMLHDRILRPAEVGVTVAVDKNESSED
ncbi:GrpE protein-like [Heracleum sosnowskyi]|uniref:GrpE protein homolog n=1 Tax=Heracleum sosnowskyi TaxID=360622 RepID=A0AAD8IU36_9APIA|nr:GrpE protein-like [Heracleum sosnowskyi]